MWFPSANPFWREKDPSLKMQSGYLEGKFTSAHDIPLASASPNKRHAHPKVFSKLPFQNSCSYSQLPFGDRRVVVCSSGVSCMKGRERERGFDSFKPWKEKLKEARGKRSGFFTFFGKSREGKKEESPRNELRSE